MSNIKADNFTWKTGETGGQATPISITGEQLVRGTAKGWMSYSATVPTVYRSFNVSSVTKNGTGDYNINHTNSYVDVYYCASIAVQGPVSTYHASPYLGGPGTNDAAGVAHTTSYLKFSQYVVTNSGARGDSAVLNVILVR